MILTDYYRFERTAVKAQYRLDCVASTGGYPPLEELRTAKARKETAKRDAIEAGSLRVYWVKPDGHVKAAVARQADRSMTAPNMAHLSSVFNWRQGQGEMIAYGDVQGTRDALLIFYNVPQSPYGAIEAGAVLEIFVARGMASQCKALCMMYTDGELEEEIERLRTAAIPDPNTGGTIFGPQHKD